MGRISRVTAGTRQSGRGRRRPRRGGNKRYGGSYARKSQISFLRSPFPKRMLRKLVYETSVNLNAGIGTIANHAFNMISCYDPDLTGVGHQPYGWDQLIVNYDHAYVLSTKAYCTALPNNDNSAFCTWGITLRDTSGTLGSDPQTILETPYTQYSSIGYGQGGYNRTLTVKQGTKKYMGIKDVLDNSQLANTVLAGPTDGYVLEIFQFGINSTIDPGAITVRVRLEFNVMFTEPKPLTGS